MSGDERDGEPRNLIWNCRRCNTTIGIVMKRAGLGRRTCQYNPAGQGARSVGQWLTAVLSMKGESSAMSLPAAIQMVHSTPPERRSQFAREIWRIRRQHGTDRTGVPF